MHFFPGILATILLMASGIPASAQNPGNAQKGKDLFIGNIRFLNNGPTCNSCHNVNMKGLISGGVLAKDLTQSVSRLTAEGVKGIISGLPFPQMKQSYESKNLTDQEIADVTAFLQQANDLAVTTQPKNDIGKKMLLGGIGGVVVLLFLFSFFWIRRKQRTVNYSIYERQIKST